MLCKIGTLSTSYRKWLIIDYDHTLVRYNPKPSDDDDDADWDYMYKTTVSKVKGYNIVIVTNQPMFNDQIRRRIKLVCEDLTAETGKSVIAYIAPKYDIYRKPSSAVFTGEIVQHVGHDGTSEHRANRDQVLPNIRDNDEIFFVGDSAGRPGDHSDSDRKFAENCRMMMELLGRRNKIVFMTPEEFFLDEKPPTLPPLPRFELPPDGTERRLELASSLTSAKKSCVMLIGPPCCGKTTFAKAIEAIKGKVRIIKDMNKAPASNIVVLISPGLHRAEVRNHMIDILDGKYDVKYGVFNMGKEFYMRMNVYAVKKGHQRVRSSTYDEWYEALELPAKYESVPFSNMFADKYEMAVFCEHFSRW